MSMSVHEALRLWLRSRIVAGRRSSTITHYERAIRTFLDYTNAACLDAIQVEDVRDYLAHRSAGWKPATVAVTRDTLVIFFNWCASEELMPPVNWLKRVPKVVVDRGSPKRLTPEQVKRLLVATELYANRRDQAIVHVLLDTGLRSGEVLRLMVGDVDFDCRSLRVDCACKGRRERHVWFTAQTAKRLKAHLRTRKRECSHLFSTRSGAPLGSSHLLHLVKHLGYEAGIQDMTVHKLRHTALTVLAEAGMSPILLQRYAGHASITTTLLYARPDDRAVRAEYERVRGVG
jgi:integrase/recombinase XerD